MLGSSRQPPLHRRRTLGWPVFASLALHLTLFLSLLMMPPTQPPIPASEPLTMDVMVGTGPVAATPESPAPSEPTAAPIAPPAPVQQAEAPAPAPEVPPAPPVQQVETPTPAPDVPPPPPPVQQVETPAPAPDVPPPPAPVQQAEAPAPAPDVPPPPPPPPVQEAVIPAPPPVAPPPPPVQHVEKPAPAPRPVPPSPPPVAQAHPPRAPPQRAAAHAPSANPPGAPAHAPAGQTSARSAGDANNGAAWMGKLKQWWDQHSFYPKEASQTDEGGSVKVRIVIAPDGQVTSIEVVQSSGLSVLDSAAVAVFRNAHLPPFPPGTPAQPADVVVTLHYRPADSGG